MHFVSIGFCQQTNEQRMTTFFTQQLATKERVEKDSNDYQKLMVTEFKLTVVHVAQMQTCACAWIYRWTKNCGKSGLGHWAVVGRGPAFSKTPV